MSQEKRYNAVDTFATSDFIVTDSGFLIAPGNIARTGVQTYYAYEFGLQDRDPKSKVVLYRPEEEVFDQASMSSFENAPVTINHPKEWVTPANWSHLAKGEAVNISKVGNTFLKANIVVKSKDAIDLIKKGKKQLSNGYSFTLDWTPGVTPEGEKYDGVQKNIRGNHVAIVDQARCGSACRIFDNEPQTKTGGYMADRNIVVDGIPLEVNDAAAAVIEKLQKKITDQQGEITTLNQSVEKLTTDIKAVNDSHAVEMGELKKQVMTPEQRDAMVADWAVLLEGATKLAPTVITKGKDCETIRREVLESVVSANDERAKLVQAVVSDLKVATGEQLKTAFSVALTATGTQQAPNTSANDVGKHFKTVGEDQSATGEQAVGRDSFLMKSANAWQGERK
jgi:uncharacterized protein